MRMVLRDAMWMVCAGFAGRSASCVLGKRIAASLIPDLPVADSREGDSWLRSE